MNHKHRKSLLNFPVLHDIVFSLWDELDFAKEKKIFSSKIDQVHCICHIFITNYSMLVMSVSNICQSVTAQTIIHCGKSYLFRAINYLSILIRLLKVIKFKIHELHDFKLKISHWSGMHTGRHIVKFQSFMLLSIYIGLKKKYQLKFSLFLSMT